MGWAKYTEDNFNFYEERIAMQEYKYCCLNRSVRDARQLNSDICIIIENGRVQVIDIDEYLNCIHH